jgi:hypothetical protein
LFLTIVRAMPSVVGIIYLHNPDILPVL